MFGEEQLAVLTGSVSVGFGNATSDLDLYVIVGDVGMVKVEIVDGDYVLTLSRLQFLLLAGVFGEHLLMRVTDSTS